MRSRINRITSLFLIVSVLFSFCSCFAEESEFPELIFPQDDILSEEPILDYSPYSDNNFHEITVALPYSSDTVNYLMKLFYAKSNDMFPEGQTGLDISLEYLDAISTTWIVNSISTTGEGDSYDTIITLNNQNSMPDLFLTSDMIRLRDVGLIVPLDSYLSDNSYITSSIFLGTLESMLLDDGYYGLPLYSTVYLIAGNKDYVPEIGIPPFSMSEEELSNYVDLIENEFDIESVYNPNDFNRFLGEDFFTGDSITNGDSRLSRTCGIWLMDSGEFNTWNSYYPDGLYFTMLPTDNVYAMVYPLCVSSTSNEIEFACDFASFICFDRDAQMLINRLESGRGYFPVISNPALWDSISSDSIFGSQAMLYQQFLGSAIYSLPEDS